MSIRFHMWWSIVNFKGFLKFVNWWLWGCGHWTFGSPCPATIIQDSLKKIIHHGSVVNWWLSYIFWIVCLWNYGKGPWSGSLLPYGIFRFNGIDFMGHFASFQCPFGLPQILHGSYSECLSLAWAPPGSKQWTRDLLAGWLRRAPGVNICK